MSAQNKVRGIVQGDVGAQFIAPRGGQFLIICECIGIDIDLPSDAAIMVAMLRNAFKIVVIIRFDCFHS